MNKKKIVISILAVSLIPLSGALIYLQTQKATDSIPKKIVSSKTSQTDSKEDISKASGGNKEIPKLVVKKDDTKTTSENINKNANKAAEAKGIAEKEDVQKSPAKAMEDSSDKSKEVTVKEASSPKNDIGFSSDTLNREDLNGYYKVTRRDGRYSYAKMSNQGLADFVSTPTGTYLNFFIFTPITKGNAKVFRYRLDGGSDATFTMINNMQMEAIQPSFNGREGTMTYTRISKSEYENIVSKFMVKNREFSSLGDYYFGNGGQVGTMSSVEKNLIIDGKEYKLIKSNMENRKVIASLDGQTYNYDLYESTHRLVKDFGELYGS